MITSTPVIRKDLRRSDGAHLVYIRMTRGGNMHYIATEMYAGRKDLTAAGRIRNQQILQRCDRLVAAGGGARGVPCPARCRSG